MIARVLSLIATVIFAISSVHAQTPAANSFVGTWKLIAADKLLPDGTRVADYGTQPHGLAIFTADGHFMVEVFRDVRVKFASNDRAKGTPEEYKDASLSASCSFGTYSVDPASSKVTMKIDRSRRSAASTTCTTMPPGARTSSRPRPGGSTWGSPYR